MPSEATLAEIARQPGMLEAVLAVIRDNPWKDTVRIDSPTLIMTPGRIQTGVQNSWNWFEGQEPILRQYVSLGLRVVLQAEDRSGDFGSRTRRLYIFIHDPANPIPQEQELAVTNDELRRGLDLALANREEMQSSFSHALIVDLEPASIAMHEQADRVAMPPSFWSGEGSNLCWRNRHNSWGNWDYISSVGVPSAQEFQQMHMNEPMEFQEIETEEQLRDALLHGHTVATSDMRWDRAVDHGSRTAITSFRRARDEVDWEVMPMMMPLPEEDQEYSFISSRRYMDLQLERMQAGLGISRRILGDRELARRDPKEIAAAAQEAEALP